MVIYVLLSFLFTFFMDTVLIHSVCREEDVDPLFENSVYDCSPCVELIGGLVCMQLSLESAWGAELEMTAKIMAAHFLFVHNDLVPLTFRLLI